MSVTGWRSIPPLLRHCVVAVYAKTTGGGPDGVVRAFKICRDQLAKQGYLYHRGQAQILESIVLTGKGWVRSLKHESEGGSGAAKDLQFERLFKQIEPRLWEYDGPGGLSEPKSPTQDGQAHDEEWAKLTDNRSDLQDIAGTNQLYPAYKPPKR